MTHRPMGGIGGVPLTGVSSLSSWSILDRGQRFANPGVVHDAAVVKRDVEVDAHENTLIVERKIADRKLWHEFSNIVWGRHSCPPSAAHTAGVDKSVRPTRSTALWPPCN